jgi:hypothetical protein
MSTLCCGTCGNTLPITEFYKDPRRATKHKKDCKTCLKAARKGNPVINRYDRQRKRKMLEDPIKRAIYNGRRKELRDNKRVHHMQHGA